MVRIGKRDWGIADLSGAVAIVLLLILAQNARPQQYVFHAYRQAEGLDDLSIDALTLDNHGFLWVATQNGLYRFLGATFQRFGPGEGLPELRIDEVFATPDGIVWVGTAKDLYRWNGTRFLPAAPRPIPISEARRLAWDGAGRLLVSSRGRLNVLVYSMAGEFVSYAPLVPDALVTASPSLRRIGSIAALPSQTVWMACGEDLCAWHNGTLVEWGKGQGLPGEPVASILGAANGSLWTVTLHHVLELPAGATRFVDRTPPASGSRHFYARLPLATDQRGRVLVSAGDGIARWDGSQWQSVGSGNGLYSSHISALVFDATGDLWLGSTGHGLHHWVGYNDWEGWSDRQGLPSANIWSLGPFDPATAYVGTENGPARIDLASGRVQALMASSDWTYGQVCSMVRDGSGGFWISTSSGSILRIRRGAAQATLLANLDTYVYQMIQAPTGGIFILTIKGLYQLDTSAARPRPRYVDEADALFGHANPVYSASLAPDGSIWFLARGQLLRLWRGGWSRPAIAGPTSHPFFRYLSPNPVDGSLWLAGEQDGLWHLELKGDHLEETQLQLPPEYRSFQMLSVLADRRGWVWLGTDNGVVVWNGSAWRHLTQESGLIWNDTNGNRFSAAPDGSLWVGTSGGLGHILHPEQIFTPVSLPLSMIAIQRGDIALPLVPHEAIPWSRGDLTLRYAMPSALNRSDLTFRYCIPQLQSTCSDTQDTTARFAAVPPGSYTFEVVARNPDLNAQSAPLTVRFVVSPPWWRTTMFYAICGLLAGFLLLLLSRLRTRHLVQQKHRLEQTIQHRTRELEASQEALRIQATHDGLTGLLNRTAILARLDQEMDRCHRDTSTLTVVLLDIDHFKDINDKYGHLAGDEALRHFSRALGSSIRPYDHAGRYGGEEFLLVLPGLLASDVEDRLNALHGNISNLSVREREVVFAVNCSMGAISVDASVDSIDRQRTLAAADRSLYQAKRSGRNRVIHRSLWQEAPPTLAGPQSSLCATASPATSTR